jgi:hypothetical protein
LAVPPVALPPVPPLTGSAGLLLEVPPLFAVPPPREVVPADWSASAPPSFSMGGALPLPNKSESGRLQATTNSHASALKRTFAFMFGSLS